MLDKFMEDVKQGKLLSEADLKSLCSYVQEIMLEESTCLLYTSPSPRDKRQSRMPSSA